jgi:hypothetical protein
MYDLQTCEDILKKSQRIEMDYVGTLCSTIAKNTRRQAHRATKINQKHVDRTQ